MRRPVCIILACTLAGCGTSPIGQAPEFSSTRDGQEHNAMMFPGLPMVAERRARMHQASLWSGGRQSLLGDRRAMARGDILTVVVEIDEKAEISNSSSRSRSGSESLGLPHLLGVPQRINKGLPDGASLDNAVSLDSASKSSGDGSVRRKEKLTLRVAATIVDMLPNGVLAISGTQEVRVNNELRELLVTGFVRPEGYLAAKRNHLRQNRFGPGFLWRKRADHRHATTAIRAADTRRGSAVLTGVFDASSSSFDFGDNRHWRRCRSWAVSEARARGNGYYQPVWRGPDGVTRSGRSQSRRNR